MSSPYDETLQVQVDRDGNYDEFGSSYNWALSALDVKFEWTSSFILVHWVSKEYPEPQGNFAVRVGWDSIGLRRARGSRVNLPMAMVFHLLDKLFSRCLPRLNCLNGSELHYTCCSRHICDSDEQPILNTQTSPWYLVALHIWWSHHWALLWLPLYRIKRWICFAPNKWKRKVRRSILRSDVGSLQAFTVGI